VRRAAVRKLARHHNPEFAPALIEAARDPDDKVRQAATGMPAVIIRMIDALATIGIETGSSERRSVLLRQAEAILREILETTRVPI